MRLLEDEEWQKKSDRWIAEKCGVDHKTVSRYREEMESTGEIPQSPIRKGADGRTTNTTNIGRKPEIVTKAEYEEGEIICERFADRAERRAGELLGDTPPKHTGRPAKNSSPKMINSSLSALGITRDQSSQWQQIYNRPRIRQFRLVYERRKICYFFSLPTHYIADYTST